MSRCQRDEAERVDLPCVERRPREVDEVIKVAAKRTRGRRQLCPHLLVLPGQLLTFRTGSTTLEADISTHINQRSV